MMLTTQVDLSVIDDAISVLSRLHGAGARLALEQIRRRYFGIDRDGRVV